MDVSSALPAPASQAFLPSGPGIARPSLTKPLPPALLASELGAERKAELLPGGQIQYTLLKIEVKKKYHLLFRIVECLVFSCSSQRPSSPVCSELKMVSLVPGVSRCPP